MRNIRNFVLASATATALVASLSIAPVASAQTSGLPGLSALPGLSDLIEDPVGDALDDAGVVGEDERALQEATDTHLEDMGHTPNEEAERIALSWVAEAALNRVDFKSDAGKGSLGADRGEGQVYRLAEEDVDDRIAWLDRDANQASTTYGYGTAVINDTNGTVYLAEFFLGA